MWKYNFAWSKNGFVLELKNIFISTFPLLLLVQPPDNHRYRLSSTSQAPLLQEHEVTRNFLCHHWHEYFGSLLIYNRTRGNNVQRNPLEIRQWYIYTPWLPNVFLRQKQARIEKSSSREPMLVPIWAILHTDISIKCLHER